MFWMTPYWMVPQSYYYPLSITTQPEIPPTERDTVVNPPQITTDQENEQKIREKHLFWKFFKRLLRRKYMKPQKKAWNKDEDNLLVKLRQEGMQWEEIAEKIGVYNPVNCERRFQRLEKLQLKWPEHIDLMIKQFVQEKNMKWIDIAKSIQSQSTNSFNYTGKMVRERYKNYLRPGIQKKQWFIADDIKLMKLVLKNGTIWSRFTEHMQGRSELELKNRYHGILQPMKKRVVRSIHEHLKMERQAQNQES